MSVVRYVIAGTTNNGGWEHIFSEQGRERKRAVRFVYDRTAAQIVYADVFRNNCFIQATQNELDDLLDSLHNGNEDAIDDPDSYDLKQSSDIPSWARS